MAPVPDPSQAKPGDASQLPDTDLGPEVIEVASGSESASSDEEDDDYGGYVPLAQGPANSDTESDGDTESAARSAEPTSNKSAEKAMPDDKVNQIKSVMANIKLPSIPEWAEKIPESQWMGALLTNMQRKVDQSGAVTTTTTSATTENSTSNCARVHTSATDNFADFEANFPS